MLAGLLDSSLVLLLAVNKNKLQLKRFGVVNIVLVSIVAISMAIYSINYE